MKLRNFFLFGLFVFVSYTNCSKQLFESLSKGQSYQHKTQIPNSIFDQYTIHHKKDNLPKQGLFDSLNFSQFSERQMAVSPKSVGIAQNQKINEEQLLKDTTQEIQSLKNKQQTLIELNSQIKKKLERSKKITMKHNDLGKGIITFIQKNESHMSKLKKDWEMKNIHISNKIAEKEGKLEEIQNRIRSKVVVMKQRLEILEQRLAGVEMNNQSQMVKAKESLALPEINVANKLEVENTIKANRIIAKDFEVGGVKFQSDQIIFSSDSIKLLVGNEPVALKDLARELSLVQGLESRCGYDLSKCRAISIEEMEYKQQHQEKMLKEIIALREKVRTLKNK